MLAHVKILSLWEIAHYWHDYDPRRSKTHHLPLKVRDTLLVLSMTYSKKLNIRVEQDKAYLLDILGRAPRFTSRHYRHTFKKSIDKKVFGKRFFSNMFLTRSQLAKWCIDNKEPLPKFWFPDNEKHPFDLTSDNLIEEMSAGGRYKLTLLYDDTKKADSKLPAEQSCTTTVSNNAIKAANAKHAPTNAIKDRFISFYLAENSKHNNKTTAAKHFFDSLDKKEQLLFNSCDTATRTLLKALRKHVNGGVKRYQIAGEECTN